VHHNRFTNENNLDLRTFIIYPEYNNVLAPSVREAKVVCQATALPKNSRFRDIQAVVDDLLLPAAPGF
jgi:hypothetical protein